MIFSRNIRKSLHKAHQLGINKYKEYWNGKLQSGVI